VCRSCRSLRCSGVTACRPRPDHVDGEDRRLADFTGLLVEQLQRRDDGEVRVVLAQPAERWAALLWNGAITAGLGQLVPIDRPVPLDVGVVEPVEIGTAGLHLRPIATGGLGVDQRQGFVA
jgi:hypothetical protein